MFLIILFRLTLITILWSEIFICRLVQIGLMHRCFHYLSLRLCLFVIWCADGDILSRHIVQIGLSGDLLTSTHLKLSQFVQIRNIQLTQRTWVVASIIWLLKPLLFHLTHPLVDNVLGGLRTSEWWRTCFIRRGGWLSSHKISDWLFSDGLTECLFRLVAIQVVAKLFIGAVDDLHVARNFAFNRWVGFALLLALFVELLTSLLYVAHRQSHQILLLVHRQILMDVHLSVYLAEAKFISLEIKSRLMLLLHQVNWHLPL